MGKRVVIVGGVAGGAGTAARLRRLDETLEIIMLERGKYISFANCGLPYYIGGVIEDRDDLLVVKEELMKERFNIDVRVNSEVVEIDREGQSVTVCSSDKKEDSYFLGYDYLVLATGSRPLIPPVEGIGGERIYTIWNMDDTDRLKKEIASSSPERAVVIGGGFIGLEMAENFRHRGMKVSLVEMANHVLPNIDKDIAEVVHEEMVSRKIQMHLGKRVVKIEDRYGAKAVTLDSGEIIECDIILLSAGVIPNGELASSAGLEMNGRGGIVVDDRMATGDPRIFAVGDVVEISSRIDGSRGMIPLAGPANKQARVCANAIMGLEDRYAGTMGTSVAKIFDMAVASTGFSKVMLERKGLVLGEDYTEVKTHPYAHASYYPGASGLAIKVLYDKDGKILGAQAIGEEGADKRIDVIAAVMAMGGTVYDLKDLELCYAPPFSSAKDPVNMLGFMAENQRRGLVSYVSAEQLKDFDPAETVLLDVRGEDEVAEGHVPGITHIPLDELRSRLSELDRGKRIVVICGMGLRAYVGCRILMQNGFENVLDLAGGYATCRTVMNERETAAV